MKETNDLKKILKEKIGEKRIQRSSKENKDKILEKTLKDIGIDKKKFQEDMEIIKKNGRFQI